MGGLTTREELIESLNDKYYLGLFLMIAGLIIGFGITGITYIILGAVFTTLGGLVHFSAEYKVSKMRDGVR